MAFDVSGATKAYKEEIEGLKEENDALAKKLGKTTIERDWAVEKLKSLDLFNKKGPGISGVAWTDKFSLIYCNCSLRKTDRWTLIGF